MILTLAALIVTGVVWHKTQGSFLSVDFRGGSVLEVSFDKQVPTPAQVEKIVPGSSVTSSGTNAIIIRSKKIDDTAHQAILESLKKNFGTVTERRFSDIGPSVGAELKSKSITAIIILLIVIIVYISIVFRKMKRALSPWALGIAAVIALVHDVIIPVGVFSLLGYYMGIEITAVFVAAALTILGYSVSDTVVVFDRVRENVIRYGSKESFPDIVHKSILQTLTRSINTSMTTLLALVAIFLFGGESIKYFALALIIGIISGTYSSMFVASPIIMWWHGRSRGNPK